MAVYNSLLVKAGGSLLSDLAKADRWSEANLFIGLGGTGRDVVKNMKKQVSRKRKTIRPHCKKSRFSAAYSMTFGRKAL